MRKTNVNGLLLISIILVMLGAVLVGLFTVGCQGEQGETGPQGQRGLNGIGASGDILYQGQDATDEYLQDITGEMVNNATSTQTNIDVTYQDSTGYIDFVVNANWGTASLAAGGTVAVSHSMAGTPTSVTVSSALTQSGSAVVYSAPKSDWTSSQFIIYGYTIGGDGGVTAATSGSPSWVAGY